MLDLLGWGASTAQICGALWLASKPAKPWLPYLVMLPGAGVWLALAVLADNWSLAAMMGTFTCINLWGCWRWRP